MIRTFADKEAEKIFGEIHSRKLPQNIQQRALTKLNRIHFAARIEDLRAFPGDRLELLSPPERGEWSIRVNDQWRIVFKFISGNAYDVRICDYH